MNSTIIPWIDILAISPWIDILEQCNELSRITTAILLNCAQSSTVDEMTRQHVKDAQNAVNIAYQCLTKINEKQVPCVTLQS